MTTKYVTIEIVIEVEYDDDIQLDDEELKELAFAGIPIQHDAQFSQRDIVSEARCFTHYEKEDAEVSDFI